ncbi:MAG: hypothetical protein PG979_000143 [Rickettsia asembonensis]|nr:MAG: hypothetical protein PG979_000143 [Rickettsia asembonensis]
MIAAEMPKVTIINTSLLFIIATFYFYFNCNQLLLTKIRNSFNGSVER